MRLKRSVLCWAVLTALAVLFTDATATTAAAASNPNPGVIPVNAEVADQNGMPLTYADWGDRYNQWLLSIPRSTDLLANPSLGQDAASPVFFLPSASGSAVGELPFILEGPITLPAGKMLLVPVTWAYNGTVPLDCCMVTREQFLACAPASIDSLLLPEAIGELYASLDGRPLVDLAQYRVESAQPFVINFPADNPFSEVPSLLCGQIGAFTSAAALSDGYWLMLTPLSPGQHTITFGSDVLHTTLYVTVLPED